jgi:hypothetical protein
MAANAAVIHGRRAATANAGAGRDLCQQERYHPDGRGGK